MTALHALVMMAVATQATASSPPLREPTPEMLVPLGSCSKVVDCFFQYPLKPGHTRPTSPQVPPPPRIIPGFVVPKDPIGPGDANCPAGDCFALDPEDVCDAYTPNCLPGPNIRWPPLRCDPKHPRCPPNGILVNPHISCHPSSDICPPGGVIVTPEQCKPGEACPCGCGWTLPPWVQGCTGETGDCSNDFHVTNVTIWPPPFPPTQPHIPGYKWDPKNTCNPSVNPNCDPGDIVVPKTPECDARQPGCISKENVPHPLPCDCPQDPACPSGDCYLIRPLPCHPNDPAPEPACIGTDPIPCPAGIPGCPGGVENPDPVKPCIPGTCNCDATGFRPIRPPTVKPTDPIIPPVNPRLELDPKGDQRCSFVQTSNIPDGRISPQDCPKPQELEPHFFGNSKFPCTHDDRKPCLGELISDWIQFKGYGTSPRPNNFAWNATLNYKNDTILMVSPASALDKIWEIRLDGKSIGTTDLGSFQENRECNGPEDCLQKQAPHGYFFIPKGEHELQIVLEKGASGKRWEWAASQYKFNHVCRCAPENASPDKNRDRPSDIPSVSEEPSTPNVAPSPPPQDPRPAPDPPIAEPQQPPPIESPVQPPNDAQKPLVFQPHVEETTQTPDIPPSPPTEPPQQPSSRLEFPCSTSADTPCLGAVLRPWRRSNFAWRAPQYPNTGRDPPAPLTDTVNFQTDTILTVTDAWNKVEHFTLTLDGKPLGQTTEVDFDRRQTCGFAPDTCIQRGWSHGYFLIPKGPHELQIEWTRGKGDFRGWSTAVVFTRYNAPCSC